jgi:hypothetical protein
VYVRSFTTFICLLFQIIYAPFLKEAKDREENMESPNSRMVVEAGLDEIPQTLVSILKYFRQNMWSR